MDSLAQEEARQDLLPPPVPDALLGTQLASPTPGPYLAPQGRAAGSCLCCLAPTAAANPSSAASTAVTPLSHEGFPAPSKS